MDKAIFSMRHMLLMNEIKHFDDYLNLTQPILLKNDFPQWAIDDYIMSKTKIKAKNSIFSDEEGIWATLPLEVLQIIMAHHSRNEKRHWGSISFTLTPCHYYNNPNYNPYKNITIYQPADKYRITGKSIYAYAGNTAMERNEIKEQWMKQGKKDKTYDLTSYGKQREIKSHINGNIRGIRNILMWRNGMDNEPQIRPSKMKCKYITDDSRIMTAQTAQLLYLANDGVSEKEYKKNIRIGYISVSKGYFHPQTGFIKDDNTILKVKRKFGKRSIYATQNTMDKIEKSYGVKNRIIIKVY